MKKITITLLNLSMLCMQSTFPAQDHNYRECNPYPFCLSFAAATGFILLNLVHVEPGDYARETLRLGYDAGLAHCNLQVKYECVNCNPATIEILKKGLHIGMQECLDFMELNPEEKKKFDENGELQRPVCIKHPRDAFSHSDMCEMLKAFDSGYEIGSKKCTADTDKYRVPQASSLKTELIFHEGLKLGAKKCNQIWRDDLEKKKKKTKQVRAALRNMCAKRKSKFPKKFVCNSR